MNKIIDKLFAIGYLIAPLSFFFSRKFLLLSVVCLAVGWFLNTLYYRRDKPGRDKFEVEYLLLLFPFVIGFVGFVNDSIYGETISGFKELETRLPVLVMPILMYITTSRKYIAWIKISYVVSLVFAIGICLGYAIYKNIYFHDEIIYNWNFQKTMDFYERNPIGLINWGYFSYESLTSALGVDPVYFGLYLLIGVLIVFFWIKETPIKIRQLAGWICLSLFVLFMIFLGSRMPLIILAVYTVILFGSKILNYTKPQNQLVYLLIFAFVCIFLWSIPTARYRLTSLINDYATSKNLKPEELAVHEDMHRIYLWKVSIGIASMKPIFGNGLYGSKRKLEQYYEDRERPYFNSHSEYINSFLIFGWPGLLLSVFAIPFLLWKNLKRKNYPAMLFFLAIGMAMLTENIFGRFFGSNLYACIAPILYLKFNQKD